MAKYRTEVCLAATDRGVTVQEICAYCKTVHEDSWCATQVRFRGIVWNGAIVLLDVEFTAWKAWQIA